MCVAADKGEDVERIAYPRSVRRLHVVHVLGCADHPDTCLAVVTPSSLSTRYTDITCITRVSVSAVIIDRRYHRLKFTAEL